MSGMGSNGDLAARRQRIARLTVVGQRLGYLLYLAAAALFFTGFATSFRSGLVTAIVICLVVAPSSSPPPSSSLTPCEPPTATIQSAKG